MTHQLIITADDYGMCPEVNRAIEECLAAGALRATCVMTNMTDYADAAQLRWHVPQASIGIHWTLTLGVPAAAPTQVPDLLAANGQFWPAPEFRRRWLARRIAPEQVRTELQVQYERFVAVAGQPDFWNTHQNVHVLPGLFPLVVEVARQLGIPAMRSHRRITAPRHGSPLRYHLTHPIYWLKGQIIARWVATAAQQGMRMPAGVVSTPGYGPGKAAIDRIIPRVPWPPANPVELVIHPATRVLPELFGGLTESRLREYEVFRDPTLVERLAVSGVQVVGFEVLR
ncbi:carbohydrate deacetylase [Chloroflexus sp.]|uniref:carbohydrate deacetylase n=1 Tax=Chloroflexus sp. TaxID=1904827 RepID=UPI00262430BA|nr:ChbG/HpnK family deacetylase [uncultured Chloroflexus sp.]